MYSPITTEEKPYNSRVPDDVQVHDVPSPGTPSKVRVIFTSLWLTEWLSWFVALCSTCSIVGVLLAFNGEPLPSWPYGITLGALVSTLSTITTFCLLGPISSGLGQAKWTHYTKPRPMPHFGIIDQASRGPLGSLVLIVKAVGGLITISGAVLTIVLLAVAPFVQQVVQTQIEEVAEIGSASVPIAKSYNTIDLFNGLKSTDVVMGMKAGIQHGLLDVNANTSTFDVTPYCPSPTCGWPLYESLSLCSRCTDLTSQLSVINQTLAKNISSTVTTTALPNGLNVTSDLRYTSMGRITMVSTPTNPWGPFGISTHINSSAYLNVREPLIDIITIVPQYSSHGSYGQNMIGPYASECILQFCVQNFTAQLRGNSFSETPIMNPTYLDSTSGYLTHNSTFSNTTYTVDITAQEGFWNYFSRLFNVTVSQHNNIDGSSDWPTDASQAMFYWINSTADHVPTKLFDNIAASMAQNLRSTSGQTTTGNAFYTVTRIRVNWYWMILPVSAQFLVMLHLIAVILTTRAKKMKPWKTSIMAVLLHGLNLDEAASCALGDTASLDKINLAAETVQMKIGRSIRVQADSSEDLEHLELIIL